MSQLSCHQFHKTELTKESVIKAAFLNFRFKLAKKWMLCDETSMPYSYLSCRKKKLRDAMEKFNNKLKNVSQRSVNGNARFSSLMFECDGACFIFSSDFRGDSLNCFLFRRSLSVYHILIPRFYVKHRAIFPLG